MAEDARNTQNYSKMLTMNTCMKVLVETLKCNIYIREEIEEIVEVYTVTACICGCTHAWHLACMHAPFVHMLVGVCTCVLTYMLMLHVHV